MLSPNYLSWVSSTKCQQIPRLLRPTATRVREQTIPFVQNSASTTLKLMFSRLPRIDRESGENVSFFSWSNAYFSCSGYSASDSPVTTLRWTEQCQVGRATEHLHGVIMVMMGKVLRTRNSVRIMASVMDLEISSAVE